MDDYLRILNGDLDLFELVARAGALREKYWGRGVKIHVLNNVENGGCKEDCKYCAQSRKSFAKIEIYPMKERDLIIEEAKKAYEAGAFRYCMVFSGAGSTDERVEQLVGIIKEIKSNYDIEVCVSAGFIDAENLKRLKKAGLNRLNHNLNTSFEFYNKICSTHTYKNRLNMVKKAKKLGLQVCSGVIIGMGEDYDDILNMALALKDLKVESIPVNFFIPIKGVPLKDTKKLTPEFCLRVLCLFRLLNPQAEIRMAAGRELHLRELQGQALKVANSLFVNGYLNVPGSNFQETVAMIKKEGFEIVTPIEK